MRLVHILVVRRCKNIQPGNSIRIIDYFPVGCGRYTNMKQTDFWNRTQCFETGNQFLKIFLAFGILKPKIHVVDKSVLERHILLLCGEINQKEEDAWAIYGAASYNYVSTKALSLNFSRFWFKL